VERGGASGTLGSTRGSAMPCFDVSDQRRALAIRGSYGRLAVRQAYARNKLERQRLGGFLAQGVKALLHPSDLFGMRSGDVVLLVGIFCEVVEVNACGNQRTPNAFPVTLPHCCAERLDVIDDFAAR